MLRERNMNEKDIREMLEDLGSKVSILAEENRVCKSRDDAGRKLISLLGDHLTQSNWIKIYESTHDSYIKNIMKDWGPHLFPQDFEK